MGVDRIGRLFVNQNNLRYSAYLAWGDMMDISKMLNELREERSVIEEAILVLERLARGRGRRRGRPPLWMTTAETTVKRRGRPPGSKNKPKDAATED
jgi:hypothetical protein